MMKIKKYLITEKKEIHGLTTDGGGRIHVGLEGLVCNISVISEKNQGIIDDMKIMAEGVVFGSVKNSVVETNMTTRCLWSYSDRWFEQLGINFSTKEDPAGGTVINTSRLVADRIYLTNKDFSYSDTYTVKYKRYNIVTGTILY